MAYSIPKIAIESGDGSSAQLFTDKQWVDKNRLFIEQNWEFLGIACKSGFDSSLWADIGQYSQVGPWIGYFYEWLIRSILIKHADIKTIRKITTIRWKIGEILEMSEPQDFKLSLPDLLIEKEDGSLIFLEIKAFASNTGPVLYEDQFSGFEKYLALGIPTYHVFVGHSARNTQYRFNKSAKEKRKLFQELEAGWNISILPTPIVEKLYHSVSANSIHDKRNGRNFKRIRAGAILEICDQYKVFASEEIRMLTEEIKKWYD